ncbi:hypothetical protein ABT095_34490 [Kitasatospora sp. NPDC002227]|uniref:hypothetical protein n=1 Tax=Kitasatospora sp. NPDC002227 TaxID=3154773 RepID=UPI003321D88C
MSIHLMIVAAYLPEDVVNPTQKLALMKICDSADDESRLARPGMVRLRAWTGVGRTRATTIVTELVEKGLVERVELGRPGRAALFRVFPLGLPSIPSTEELKARQAAADAAPKNAAKARKGVKRAAPSAPARTYADVEARKAAARAEHPEPGGFHHGNPPGDEADVPPVEPNEFHARNPARSTGGTLSFPVPSSALPHPPTPAAGATGEPAPAADDTIGPPAAKPNGCPTHRKTAKNCRACGTSPRAQRAKQEAERKDAERAQEGQFWERWHSEADARRDQAEKGAQALQAAKQRARAVAAEARSRSQK